ncbi:MAG: hypothetical protein ACK5LJ_18030 [Paracoccus sp. (in: a-proteobacteria)]
MNEQMTAGVQASNGDYALAFQPDGVQLLHRDGDDWAELGRVAFDGDLRGGLGDFARQLHHANAPGLSLVIPDDQILYADLVLPAAANMAESLRAGLEGLTPYAVEDLAFDYAPADARPGSAVTIAAVARQTLQEAEDFAVRHGFAPDRFLAMPVMTKFPYEPDFGATGLAMEWELAADLTGADPASLAEGQTAPDLPAADAGNVSARAILAAPVLTRITPHIVSAPVVAAPPVEMAGALVNLGSIILPGDGAASETAHAAVLPDPAVVAAPAVPAGALRTKPMSERARAFHERALEARRNQIEESLIAPPAPLPAAMPRGAAAAVAAAGRRSGLTGALPMVGILILGLGIAAVLTAREPRIDAPPAAEMAPLAEPTIAADPGPSPAGGAGPIPAAPGTAAEADRVTAPLSTAAPAALPSENPPETGVSAGMAPAEVTPDVAAAPGPATSGPPQAANLPEPVELPGAPPPAVAATAAEAAAESSAAAPAPKANVPPRSSPAPAATTHSARPKARPTSPAQANTSAARSSPPAASTTSRPASRPAAATSSQRTGAVPAPGAPDSATLKSSVRPKTAPVRSAPAAS